MRVYMVVLSNEETWYDSEDIQVCQYIAILNKENIENKLYHLAYRNTKIYESERLLNDIQQHVPCMVYLSISNDNTDNQLWMAEKIQEIAPSVHICFGGPLVTSSPSEYIEKTNAIAIIGEGEVTLPDLINHLQKRLPLDTCDGIAYISNGTCKINKPRKAIEDLDSLPYPDRSMHEQSNYDFLKVLGNRGCFNRCSFCLKWKEASIGSKKSLRERSISSIIQEIELLVKRYDVTTFMLWDDAFEDSMMGTKEKITQFCNALGQISKKIFFKINLKSKTICRLGIDFMRYMKENGLINIFIGLESGCDETLQLFNKHTTVQENIHAIDILHALYIPFRNGFIMFHPYSTLKEYKQNIDFIHRIGQEYRLGNFLKMFLLYKNCDLYEMVKQDNLISEEYSISNLFGYRLLDPQIHKVYSVFEEFLDQKKNLSYLGVKFIERCDVLDDLIAKLDVLSNRSNQGIKDKFQQIKETVNAQYYKYFDMVYEMAEKNNFENITYSVINKKHLIRGIDQMDHMAEMLRNDLKQYL